MHLPPLAVLLAWIPLGAYLFRRLPPRAAILANFLGGWAILPGANYTPSNVEFPYWILDVCLPTGYLVTKATVTGIAALAGTLLFHRPALRSFRPDWRDLPMALWCCVPLLSAAAHWSTLRDGLLGAIYQTLAWGTPWLLGRIFFSDRDGLLVAAKGVVISGLCYVPICLMEICTGPQLYAFFYGYQPYRSVGAARYLGYRPIGFLEDGNQLGIWMAAATLLAVSFAVYRIAPRILGLPMQWVAATLALTTLLCQSAGSILLLAILLPLTLLRRRALMRGLILLLVLAIVGFALFRMAGKVSLRDLARSNGLVHSLAEDLQAVGRHSFAWRLARDESNISLALQNPILGSGRWDWWQSGDFRPWSLWMLIFGMYGAVGLCAFAGILLLPVLQTVWHPSSQEPPSHINLRWALVGLILLVAFDNLLNGAMILPYLVAIGALSSGSRDWDRSRT